MEILSLNEIESIDHEQNSIVIYFDSSNEYNDIIDDFKIQLHEINKSLIIHTELESCINFIKLNEQKNLILIISNSSISQILSHIINLHQINSIFIFGLKKDQFKYSFLINLKIIGIYDKIDLLYISIKERINLIEKRTHPCCFFDQIKYENKDLSKQSNDFLWYQLFHIILFDLSHNQQTKRQKIDLHYQYYQDIIEKFQLNDQFKHEYQPNKAIYWYLNNSLFRKIIDNALKTKDINQLYSLRYFLKDFILNIKYEYQQMIQSNKITKDGGRFGLISAPIENKGSFT